MRIRQKRMSNDAEDCTEHSIIWGMFMATTLNAVTFMGKSYSTMQNVVQNEENLTLKQMFDITAQTIHNEEEIYCLDKVVYQKNTWTQLSLINDPVIISLQSTKVYVFSDSVLCLGKVLQHPECNEAWKNRVAGVRAERNYSDFEDMAREMGSPRQVSNRRRRTRKGPEPACVQTPYRWGGTCRGGKDELTSCTQGSSGRPASDLGWGSSSKTAPGSLSTGSPAGRTPPHGDGSMYSQANVRVESVLRPPPERGRP